MMIKLTMNLDSQVSERSIPLKISSYILNYHHLLPNLCAFTFNLTTNDQKLKMYGQCLAFPPKGYHFCSKFERLFNTGRKMKYQSRGKHFISTSTHVFTSVKIAINLTTAEKKNPFVTIFAHLRKQILILIEKLINY